MFNHLNAAPGNGKSAFLMVIIEREFVKTKRNIVVWSLPLQVEILAYFNRRYPRRKDELNKRLLILTFEQGLQWWRYRGYLPCGSVQTYIPTEKQITGDGCQRIALEWPLLPAEDNGVTYILDEFTDAYPISMSTVFTPEHRSALTQHRKFRADVWCACPTFDQLAKPYRDIGQAFYTVRNTSFEQVGRGKVSITLPETFQWAAYKRPPISDRDRPFITGSFVIHKTGIHACYNTAGGAGVNNLIADQDRVRPGMNKLWLIPILALSIFLIVGLLRWLPVAGTKLLMGIGAGKTSSVVKTNSTVKLSQAGQLVLPASRSLPTPPPQVARSFQDAVSIVWVSRVGADLRFGLSDGRTLDNPPAIWDGQRLLMRDGSVLKYVQAVKIEARK